MEIDVDRPAAEVWQRIGGYCDIEEWFQIPCTITSGTEDEFGTVRSVGNEVLVGKTELSYTYTQTPERADRTTSITEPSRRGRSRRPRRSWSIP